MYAEPIGPQLHFLVSAAVLITGTTILVFNTEFVADTIEEAMKKLVFLRISLA